MVSYLDHQHRHHHHHHHHLLLHRHHHQVMLMGSSPAELTLGLMPFTDKADVDAGCGGHGRKASKQLELEHYLKSLEEERKKIEAFKRELPFCMALLTTAIEASKEQLASHLRNPPSESKDSLEAESGHCHTPNREDDGASIATIFRPLNQEKDQGSEDARPWLHGTTAQTTKFWSLEEAYAHGEEIVSSMGNGDIITCCNNGGGGSGAIMKPIPISCERRGGAFTPFLKAKNTSSISVLDQTSPREVSSSPIVVGDKEDYGEIRSPSSSSPHPNGTSYRDSRPAPTTNNTTVKNSSARISNAAPQSRKQRRCWSPELHRRFVHALHQLGGSQCATPKQIRELMNVDDLTNDEVKSHLQKYRLHTRRQTSGSFEKAAMAHDVPQLVVLGGIWVPQGFTSEGFKQQSIASALPSETHLCLISSSGDAKHRGDSAHESYSEEDNSEAEDGRVY